MPGHNISCDLHMEHLNRLAKTAVDGLGANKTEKAIFRVGKTVGSLFRTTENFDKQDNVTPPQRKSFIKIKRKRFKENH